MRLKTFRKALPLCLTLLLFSGREICISVSSIVIIISRLIRKWDHDKDQEKNTKKTTRQTHLPPDSPSWNNIATELPTTPHTLLTYIKSKQSFISSLSFSLSLSLSTDKEDQFCASKLAHTRSLPRSIDRSLVSFVCGATTDKRSLVHARGTRSVEELRMVSSGWMNRDEDRGGGGVLFVSFGCSTDQKCSREKKTACKALVLDG